MKGNLYPTLYRVRLSVPDSRLAETLTSLREVGTNGMHLQNASTDSVGVTPTKTLHHPRVYRRGYALNDLSQTEPCYYRAARCGVHSKELWPKATAIGIGSINIQCGSGTGRPAFNVGLTPLHSQLLRESA